MAGSAVRIRLAGYEDIPAVLAVLNAHATAHSTTDTAESLQVAVRARAVLLARIDAAIIGVVVAGFDGWRGNLYRLAVDTAYRRRGIGTALVRAAERKLARKGAQRITILIEQSDSAAVMFWQTCGYTPDPDMIRAVKMLSPL